MITFTGRIILAIGAVLGVALLFTFQRPPAESVQRGYRGTGMVEIFDPRHVAAEYDINKLPATLPPLHAGPPASTVYKNVQVLGDLDVGAFTRLMASITTWVAPQQGCAYCHSLNNMASDAVYTKVVARRMIQMVRHINSDWTTHVADHGRDLLHMPPRPAGAGQSVSTTEPVRRGSPAWRRPRRARTSPARWPACLRCHMIR